MLYFDYESFPLVVNEFINNTGDLDSGLSKREHLILNWANYIYEETKFKNIQINYLNSVTFESSNRLYQLEIIDDTNKIYQLTYNYRNGNKYDKIKGQIKGDFVFLRNWFKKRNYLR